MIKNKYFEKIAPMLVFFSEHFRFAVFLFFLFFLFYIAMLGIEISSAIDHISSAEDINKKIPAVNIRKDLIKKIDNFILVREKEANGPIIDKNPFLPYQKEIDNLSSGAPAASSDASLPEVMP